MGNLWITMTDEQRNSIKQEVFNQTLTFNNLQPEDYQDMCYVDENEDKDEDGEEGEAY